MGACDHGSLSGHIAFGETGGRNNPGAPRRAVGFVPGTAGASEMSRRRTPGDGSAQVILKHWREAVPDDRLAHLVKDATRALVRALQMRLTEHSVSFGHWTFLRILWEGDCLTQRELSEQAGVMEPTTFSALNAMERLGYVTRRKR